MTSLVRGAWAQLLLAALGLWLMAAPALLGYGADPAGAAIAHRIVGPMLVSVGVVASAGMMRGVRWLALPLGAVLLISPWLSGYGTTPLVVGGVTGLLAILLGCVHGAVRDRHGGGWSSLVRKEWSDTHDGTHTTAQA